MPSFVVVGASRGLGYEWLRSLSADEANTVIGTARTPAAVNTQLKADGINNVHVLQADMIDQKSLQAAAAKVAELTGGAVDYLILNGAYLNPKTAGLSPVALADNESLLREEMKQNIDVNVIGVMFAINAFLPLVRKSDVKKITVLSTGMADFDLVANAGISFGVAYGAIKAALNMVVLKYSIELKSEGIILLLLSPGVVNTALEAPSEDELATFQVMAQKFQALYPDFKGPISAADSVAMQKGVIDKITLEDSGAFLSHLGTKQWL